MGYSPYVRFSYGINEDGVGVLTIETLNDEIKRWRGTPVYIEFKPPKKKVSIRLCVRKYKKDTDKLGMDLKCDDESNATVTDSKDEYRQLQRITDKKTPKEYLHCGFDAGIDKVTCVYANDPKGDWRKNLKQECTVRFPYEFLGLDFI